MLMNVLVTGGAGFIGSHLVDALIDSGHKVIVLDSLEPAVHDRNQPPYLNPRAKYLWQDIRDADAVSKASENVEVLFHLASLIDVEESVRDPGKYVDVNVMGTATLLDSIVGGATLVERLILASSVAVYGEGSYVCSNCGPVKADPRPKEQLERGEWDVLCPDCGRPLEPQATSEGETPTPMSTYGLTKLTQEKLFEAASRKLGIPAVILRLANVYGPRQRSGPYAGVCTTFYSRLQVGVPPTVHEDGLQTRDYIHVEDVVRANLLSLEAAVDETLIVNIGTGKPVTVLQLAELLNEMMGSDISPEMKGTFRSGDIRHLWVDPRTSKERLGFTSSVDLREGLEATLRHSD